MGNTNTVTASTRYELHDGITASSVCGTELTLQVSVGPRGEHDSYVYELLVTCDMAGFVGMRGFGGGPTVVGLIDAWDDDGKHVPVSGIPVDVIAWVENSREVTDAAERVWSDHCDSYDWEAA